MLDVLDKHKLIGGKGMNTLTYLETTDEDFNEGELNGVVCEGGALKIPTRVDDKCELLIKGDLPCVDLSPIPKTLTAVTTSYADAEKGDTLTFNSGQYIKLDTEIVILEEEDFTIEFNIKRISSDVASNRWLISDTTGGGGNGSDIRLCLSTTSGSLSLAIKTLTLSISNISNYITIGNWHTLAITRYNNIVSIYVDNNRISYSNEFKDSFTIQSGTHLMNWRESYTRHYSNCYLSELLITRKALYTGEDVTKLNRLSPQITTPRNLVSAKCNWEGEGKVSTYQYTKKQGIDENTVLYLKGEDFTDSSLYNKPITNVGATINSNGKVNSGIELANTRINIDRGMEGVDLSKDFTIDWWEYSTGATTGSGLILNRTVTNSNYYGRCFLIGHNGTLLYAGTSSATTSWNIFNAVKVKDKVDNVWVHWAFVKKGTKYTTYKNGVEFWTTTNSSVFGALEGNKLCLGAWIDYSTVSMGYNAIIDNFRISNIARWEENFTPPEKDYELDEELITPLEKGKTITSLPSNFQLKQEVEGEETISNVSLEMKYKLEDTSTVPKEEGEDNTFYLYNEGDECDKLTGGYFFTKHTQFNSSTSRNSLTNTSSSLDFYSYNPNYPGEGGIVTSRNLIDLTPYSKMYVEYEKIGDGYHTAFGIKLSTGYNAGDTPVKISPIVATTTPVEFDISNVNTNGCFYVEILTNNGASCTVKIKKIWLEK